jgi:hypothetical protein
LIENARVERKLGWVQPEIVEYLDLIKQDDVTGPMRNDLSKYVVDYVEIGIKCGRCNFLHIGDDWKAVLVLQTD